MKTQRDAFLEVLFDLAKKDENIILLSVDMGAPALDRWRSELPKQFFEMGISEQNAINVACGMSRGGKKVYVYFMAVWVHRCFEQIRYSAAIGNNPITILGNGVGYGYAPAGPAHEPNEDLNVMRTLHGIKIWSPSSYLQIEKIVKQTLTNPGLNYVRLERTTHQLAEKEYSDQNSFATNWNKLVERNESQEAWISYGFTTGLLIEAISNKNSKPIDLFSLNLVWPIPTDFIKEISIYNEIIFVEEQSSSGSLGENLGSTLLENNFKGKFKRLNLPDKYIFDNANRIQRLEMTRISVDYLVKLAEGK